MTCQRKEHYEQASDEIREDLQWAVRNGALPVELPDPFRLTSMPLDPTAEDFHERVNAVSAGDIEQSIESTSIANGEESGPKDQRELF